MKENKCFVCEKLFEKIEMALNNTVNLYVCVKCQGTNKEKNREEELMEGQADGFVCGCI